MLFKLHMLSLMRRGTEPTGRTRVVAPLRVRYIPHLVYLLRRFRSFIGSSQVVDARRSTTRVGDRP